MIRSWLSILLQFLYLPFNTNFTGNLFLSLHIVSQQLLSMILNRCLFLILLSLYFTWSSCMFYNRHINVFFELFIVYLCINPQVKDKDHFEAKYWDLRILLLFIFHRFLGSTCLVEGKARVSASIRLSSVKDYTFSLFPQTLRG